MDKYLVETSHTANECLHVLDQVLAHGYITHYDWGCEDGTHTGWAVIEAESKEQAMYSVPPLLRNKARIVKLNKFTPESIEAMHKNTGKK